MPKRLLLLLLVGMLTACGPSPWDGTETSTRELEVGKLGCECLYDYLSQQGVNTELLVASSTAFEADRELVRSGNLSEMEMRAKYPQEFDIAESLPGIMEGFVEYPCNQDLQSLIEADSIQQGFSRALKIHCLLSSYFKQ